MMLDFNSAGQMALLFSCVFIYTLLVMWGGDHMKEGDGFFPGAFAAVPMFISAIGTLVCVIAWFCQHIRWEW
jgi:hypothetical protein